MLNQPSPSKDNLEDAKPSKAQPRSQRLGLVAIPAGLGTALLLDSLTHLVLQGATAIDTSRLKLTMGAFFFAEWFVLAVLFLWRARNIGTVLSRSLLFFSVEWFAVSAASVVLGPNLMPQLNNTVQAGLPFFFDPAASRVRVAFQVNALLSFVLGGVFLIAAFLVFRDTYEQS